MDTPYSPMMSHTTSLPPPSHIYYQQSCRLNCTEYFRKPLWHIEKNYNHLNQFPIQNVHFDPVVFCQNGINQMRTKPKADEGVSSSNELYRRQAPAGSWSPLEPPKLDFSANIAGSILEEESDIGYFSFSNRSQCSYSSDNSDSFVDSETQLAISSDLDELLDDLVSVVKEMSEKDIIKCYICGEMFKSSFVKNEHMRNHRQSRERSHECEYCGKRFSAKSALKTHVRKHTGEKPYSCPHCFRSFADKSTQRKHLRIHTGEKPYTCDVCGQKFTQSGNMTRHKLTHNRGK